MTQKPIDILLVDDRQDNLLALEAVLRDPRYRLVRASSGREALAALPDHEFAAILLDVQMPEMDGFETAHRIKQDPRHKDTPIIFITAISKEAVHVFRGYDSGAIDYLTKPFDDFVLRSKITVLADLFEKTQQVRAQQQELLVANIQLQREVAEREHAEAQLRLAHRELEQKVRDRTAALSASNDALQMEIAERQRAETELYASLKEKEILLKEIHHRVKNNLQVVSSLLNLQAYEAQDPKVRALFQDSQDRIRSMALVHETLYQSRNFTNIDMEAYLRLLIHGLKNTHAIASRVEITVQVREGFFGIDTAIPCGLILNELVSNALKHGFPGDRRGTVSITLQVKEQSQCIVTVEDDGIGMPGEVELGNSRSLGLRIVEALVQQLDGTIELHRNGGTQFVLSFPLKGQRKLAGAPQEAA